MSPAQFLRRLHPRVPVPVLDQLPDQPGELKLLGISAVPDVIERGRGEVRFGQVQKGIIRHKKNPPWRTRAGFEELTRR